MRADHPESDHRLLGRREAIVALGGIGVIWYASRAARRAIRSAFAVRPASAASTCVLAPEETEGPYYIANEPFRSDITEDHPGLPLVIRFRVRSATTCKRIAGATVEIWHADAGGNYSGINGASTTFLRGQQTTNGVGRAEFTTIYPGWYMGRTAHIHVKVHVGGTVVHTGQLYFDDTITDALWSAVAAEAPQAGKEGRLRGEEHARRPDLSLGTRPCDFVTAYRLDGLSACPSDGSCPVVRSSGRARVATWA